MVSATLPCCYFPTAVLFIDDNTSFLNNLGLRFTSDELRFYKFFDDPTAALAAINTDSTQAPLVNRFVSRLDEEVFEHRTLDVSIPTLHQEIFNPLRSNYISVIVIDQMMPGLSGLDVCRQIDNPTIKKIMLTGEADEKFAINAFNDGLIQQFIRKNSDHLEEELRQAIYNQQQDYFRSQYSIALNSLLGTPDKACILSEPDFESFFKTLCAEKAIKEYYLLDSTGSFLLVDYTDELWWLIIKSEKELADLVEFADEEDAPAEIMAPVKDRTSLIYFYSNADSCTLPARWNPFIYPIDGKFVGRHTYYYALLNDITASEFDRNKITFL